MMTMNSMNKAGTFLMGAIVVMAAFSYFTITSTTVEYFALEAATISAVVKSANKFRDDRFKLEELKDMNTVALTAAKTALQSVLLLAVSGIGLYGLAQRFVSRSMLLVFALVSFIALFLSASISVATSEWFAMYFKAIDYLIQKNSEDRKSLFYEDAKKLNAKVGQRYEMEKSNMSWTQTSMVLIAVMSACETILAIALFVISRVKTITESQV